MKNKKFIPRPKESARVINKRWSKKRESIETLANNIQRLRYNVSTDLKSDNEKIALTALVIAIMDKTAERVGNEESASNGHVGITGLKKNQVNVIGNKVILEYTGKSGVEHTKMFSDEKIAKALKAAKKNSPDKYVFTTSDNFKIKADRINRYLSDFDITAKDIRGYSANKWVITKLRELEPEETEYKRKRQFNSVIRRIAKKVGHGIATLKKHYLIPELEPNFIEKGKVIDIDDVKKFNKGGNVKNEIPSKTPTLKKDFGYKAEKYSNGGYVLLAPNGKPSNLTPEQYRLVRTPAFKKWFGDWENSPETSSKVVDENGEPLVVYHSTYERDWDDDKDVEAWWIKNFIFDPKKEGRQTHYKRRNDGAIYFSKSKKVSEQFGDNTFEFFLDFKEPIVIDAKSNIISSFNEEISKSGNKDLIIKNTFDPMPNKNIGKVVTDIFITSNPKSIKLADGTNVNFDSNNPDVRMEKGGNTKYNPYAVCTTSIGKTEGTTKRSEWDDDAMERYEKCVIQVKEKKSDGGTLTIKNKKVYEGDKKLRDMTYEEAEKYINLFHEKNGSFMLPKNFFVIWMYDDQNFSEKINSGEYDFLMFPPPIMYQSLRLGYGVVESIWKPKFQKLKGAKHLLGMIQGWYDEQNKKIIIQYMSVRPSLKRNRINTFLVKGLKKYFETNDVEFDEPTKEGTAFMEGKTYRKGGEAEILPFHYIKISSDSGDVYAIKFKPNDTERLNNLAELSRLVKKAGYRMIPIDEKKYRELVVNIDYEKLKKYKEDVFLAIQENEDVNYTSIKNGGELTDDEKSEIYSEWRELINMSASELEKFMNTEEGKEAGLSKDEADELGIKSGRESAEWIIKMKKTPNKDWTPTMWDWAKRQLSFVKRMRGNKGDLYDEKGNKTRKHTSLLIWGHNPKK